MSIHLCPSCGWPLMSRWFDDARQAVVLPNGEFRHISRLRWQILAFFRRHPGQVLDFEHIYDSVYFGRDDPPNDNALHVHLSFLRRDLAGIPPKIITRGRRSYILEIGRNAA